MASTFTYGVLPMEGPSSTTIRGTIQLCSLRSLTPTTGLLGSKLEPQEQHLLPSCGMSRRDSIITNSIDIQQQEPLPGDDRPIPYFIIRDNAFALNEWMMKPFAAAPLEQDEQVFNYRLSRARRCVENAFGILANRWGCLLNPSPRAAECRDHGECVYQVHWTAVADDAGCWSWHT